MAIDDPEQESPQAPASRELTPAAMACARWFRTFARAAKTARLYGRDNDLVVQNRDSAWDQLTEQLKDTGGWYLQVTPTEILLEDEVVVKQVLGGSLLGPAVIGPEQELPFVLYRDGVRRIMMHPTLERREYEALLDAIVQVGKGTNGGQDDLTTLLWQATLEHLEIETVPLEQTIYFSSRQPTGGGGGGGHPGQAFVMTSGGSEIRADLGGLGSRGLHRDTFDDWVLPEVTAQSVQAYQALLPRVDGARAAFLADWEAERERPWNDTVPELFRKILELSPADDTRLALGHAIATWVVDCLQHAAWAEAERALGLLRDIDPEHRTDPILHEEIGTLDGQFIADRLDESSPEDLTRFPALAVELGTPAVSFAMFALNHCERVRPRAAAVTALTYLCADDPQRLAQHLRDKRWYVVRNVVSILGQIGGSDVVDMLRMAAQHDELRVRREVVKALGSVSRLERQPVLIQMLKSDDAQLLSAALHMLTRERHPRVVKAILERVEARDFEDLTEENQRAFLGALGDIAEDDDVPDLERLLMKDGGWFARRTLWRDAAARILHRLGTPRARTVLEAGLRSRTEAIRQTCQAATSGSKAA
jgi:hypothetical protein